MNFIQKMKNGAKFVGGSIATGALMLSANAHAALDTAISTKITEGFGNAQEGAGLVVAGVAAIFGIMLIRKILR